VLGAQRTPYLRAGEWQLGTSLRWLDSYRHFAGTVEQTQRADRKNNVVNRQRIWDVSGTYALNQQCSLTLSVPVLLHGSWSIPLPINPAPGPRYRQDSSGLGDITLTARYWLLSCRKHTRENIGVGLGIKAPTGDPHVEDDFPDIDGKNLRKRAVDQSIQPGDGGWGIVFDIQTFKIIGTTTWFFSGTYLANPKDVNGTPSIVSVLRNGVLAPADEYRRYNSVPDQYVVRAGMAFPLEFAEGWSMSLAWRAEGVPRNDVFGSSNGFRRPGYATFVEPGLIYSRGSEVWSLTTPVTLLRNRIEDSKGREGDATFADYFLLFGYQKRFGR